MAKAKVKRIDHKEMQERIIAYKKLKGTVKDLEAQIKENKEAIIKVMEEFDLDSYTEPDGLLTASYKDVTSSRFDSERFEKERPDLYQKYLKETTSKRFEVR